MCSIISIPYAKVAGYNADKSVQRNFEKSDALLNHKPDKLMLLFRENEAYFYIGYESTPTIADK